MGRSIPSLIRVDEYLGVAHVFLRAGFEAAIDVADLPLVEGKAWRLLTTPTGHAYAYTRVPGKQMLLMHRMFMQSLPGEMVDHVDGDGLNNRRANLRNCSASQNQANRAADRRSKLGLKGVSKKTNGNGYRAVISPGNKKIHLGYYATPEEAAAAYRGAARLLWGKFAYEQDKKKGPASRS